MKISNFEIPTLKHIVNRNHLKKTIKKVNKAAKHINTKNIAETLQLTKSAIFTVAELIGLELKEKHNRSRKIPKI